MIALPTASSDSAARHLAAYVSCQAFDPLFPFVTPDKYFLIFQDLLPLHPQPKHNNKLFQFPQSTWLLNTSDKAPHSRTSCSRTSHLFPVDFAPCGSLIIPHVH